MQHPAAARLGPSGTEAGGAVRIVGPYPPPPPPPTRGVPAPASGPATGPAWPAVGTDGPAAVAPVPGPTRSRAGLAWSAASGVLAAAGVAAMVLLPPGTGSSARVEVPLAAAAAPAVSTPTDTPAGPAAAGRRQVPASDPVGIRIPALGMTSPVMELGLERDGSMEVPPGAYPVGWYHGSASPGQRGPAVLAGHVDWEGEPGAFYGLRELVSGDTVEVERADGTVATFRVGRVEEHAKDDFPTEAVYGHIPHAGLRLVTCGGAFDEDTGQYLSNVVVFATLIDVTG